MDLTNFRKPRAKTAAVYDQHAVALRKKVHDCRFHRRRARTCQKNRPRILRRPRELLHQALIFLHNCRKFRCAEIWYFFRPDRPDFLVHLNRSYRKINHTSPPNLSNKFYIPRARLRYITSDVSPKQAVSAAIKSRYESDPPSSPAARTQGEEIRSAAAVTPT